MPAPKLIQEIFKTQDSKNNKKKLDKLVKELIDYEEKNNKVV